MSSSPELVKPSCCNPFGQHRKPVLKGLRSIVSFDADNAYNLTVGSFLCDNCRKAVKGVVCSSKAQKGPEIETLEGQSLTHPATVVAGSSKDDNLTQSAECVESSCCNPFGLHQIPVKKNLRAIVSTPVDADNAYNLTVGSFLCDNCRKAIKGVVCSSKAQKGPEIEKPQADDVQSLTHPATVVAGSSKDDNLTQSAECVESSCCNPFGLHQIPVKKNLRAIVSTPVDADNAYNLTVGSFLCDNCRKAIRGVVCSSKTTTEAETESDTKEIVEECCNPFQLHSKQVTKSVRKIKEKEKELSGSLSVGLYWCDTCRKHAKEQAAKATETSEQPDLESTDDFGLAALFSEIAVELNTGSEPSSQSLLTSSQNSNDSGSPNLSPSVQKESAARKLSVLGLSPLVTSSAKTDVAVVAAAKRKIDQAVEIVSKKVCRAAGIRPEQLLETQESRDARYHRELMEEIRERIPTSSKLQKYQLLSLVPLGMSVNETSQKFGVSRKVAAHSKELKKSLGILPVINFSRKSTVHESTKVLVHQFYCSDENSKVLPGIRDCISVSKGVYEQKRLLLCNLPELYKLFKMENEDLKIGVSIFYSLRPKWCVFAGSAGTHEQCVCQTHQNFKLVMYALDIKKSDQELIKLCICNHNDRSCHLRLCGDCPTIEQVQYILFQQIDLAGLLPDEGHTSDDIQEYLEETVNFRQWKSTDRTEMILQVMKRSELLEVAANQMNELIPHDFIASSQRDYIKKLKEELPRDKVIVNMDFAMNYNCLLQGAVQSYHWSPKQVTILPAVLYFKDSNNEIIRKSLVFISDDLDHDVPLVKNMQGRIVKYIREKLPQTEEIEYLTDGCASQFKCKGYFDVLTHHEEENGLRASHTYFATSHGKSQCDADGGSVKRKARRASLQRPFDSQIINAHDLYVFCQQEMSQKFDFQFVPRSEVEEQRALYKEHVKALVTVPGTRTFHHFKPQADGIVACWRTSLDKDSPPSLIHSLRKSQMSAESSDRETFHTGMYVVLRASRSRYIGIITDMYEEEGEADLSLLTPRFPSNKFTWPKDVKTVTVPLPHILISLTLIEKDGAFTLSAADVLQLQKAKILKK